MVQSTLLLLRPLDYQDRQANRESDHPDAVVRMLCDDFAEANIKLRDVVTLVDSWGNESRLRLREITNTGGIMRMLCEAVNGLK